MNFRSFAEGIKNLAFGKKKIVVIVQCRMSSTRLPGKALMKLYDKSVLEWTLNSMRKVKAHDFYLAVDEGSREALEPVAKKCGWKFYAGSLEDVLDRFCNVIKISKADIVVRATADNPFLFYEAAEKTIEKFLEFEKTDPVDYLTFSGLPHGSGIEMFNAHSLLKAAEETDLPYDHEHVGPALYNHKDKFKCEFIKAPAEFNHPEYRTTIDTREDFFRAGKIVQYLFEKYNSTGPYSTPMIIEALESQKVKNPVLLIPSVKKGQGTGHLRRCLELAVENEWDIYIPENADLPQIGELIEKAREKGLSENKIIKDSELLPFYKTVFTDLFRTEESFGSKLSSFATVIAVDEGSEDCNYADYILDVIPSASQNRVVNCAKPELIPRPRKIRTLEEKQSPIRNALVVLGGEDPAGLTLPSAIALAENGVYVTAIMPSESELAIAKKKLPEKTGKFINLILPVDDLREKLFRYDLVVTHYGFTAFEAASANCAVILLGTSNLHVQLALNYGFKCIASSSINKEIFAELLNDQKSLYIEEYVSQDQSLAEFTRRISMGHHFDCPVCRKKDAQKNRVVFRIPQRTFRRCGECGMIYISWTEDEKQTEYNQAYFFEDYEKQYGKTYLDDFESIKSQCVRRIGQIDFIHHRSKRHSRNSVTPTVLDIGCAMGPFLSAASDSGWQVFGTDISQEAVDYVQKTLNFPAVCSAFPDVDSERELGVEKFDAVTMWYVIEHFQDLDSVLKKISTLVKKGGVFAFSTPSASGISARFNTRLFFEQSPSDHFTIWELKNAKKILAKYGFKIMKIVPTGIHPERLSLIKKVGWKNGDVRMKFAAMVCRTFKLGDTVEIYCKKK